MRRIILGGFLFMAAGLAGCGSDDGKLGGSGATGGAGAGTSGSAGSGHVAGGSSTGGHGGTSSPNAGAGDEMTGGEAGGLPVDTAGRSGSAGTAGVPGTGGASAATSGESAGTAGLPPGTGGASAGTGGASAGTSGSAGSGNSSGGIGEGGAAEMGGAAGDTGTGGSGTVAGNGGLGGTAGAGGLAPNGGNDNAGSGNAANGGNDNAGSDNGGSGNAANGGSDNAGSGNAANGGNGNAGSGASGSSGSGGGTSGGAGASAGGSGGAPAVCQDGTSELCCQGGHRTCSGGIWGACEGARISAETCNGVDDDCNGQIDDVGTLNCGVGVCATSVAACGANGANRCVPLPPAASFDGCDGVDNDCDGAVDEDCTECVHVAPNGDDAVALGDGNATPFATVQAAIDYAAAHPSAPTRVCVAAGATCADSATYLGPSAHDLTMRDGIDVFANYEATSWTRCTTRNTQLAPQTPNGIAFPASITSPTTLDGFSIVRFQGGSSTAAVTVDGATNVVLSNLLVPANPVIDYAYGIVLQNGAEALVYRSRIEVYFGNIETVGIKSVDSTLRVDDSSGAVAGSPGSAACSPTGNGVVVATSSGGSGPVQRGVLLESSPGSVIENSDVCAELVSAGATPNKFLAGVLIHGDATGVMLHGNRLASRPFSNNGATLAATDCGGESPWIARNEITIPNSPSSGSVIYAAGDCHPRIDSNPAVVLTGTANSWGTAIHCGSLGGVDSRCIISHNPSVGVSVPNGSFPLSAGGTGVQCDGSACERIDHNYIAGALDTPTSMSCGVSVTGWGVQLGSSSALVSGNVIVGVAGTAINADGIGLSAGGPARIENNFIYGGYSSGTFPGQCGGTKSFIGLSAGGLADVDSNYIRSGLNACWAQSGFPSSSARYGYGVSAAGGSFRNNVIEGCVSFRETSTTGEPLVFENNDLPNGYLDEGATYPNADFSDPRLTAAQVNALTDMTAQGNISAACFAGSAIGAMHLAAGSACIDAGTSSGAPTTDYDGQARDAAPDIGPDEYVP